MKITLFFFLVLLFNGSKIYSQSPDIQWQKSIGGSLDDQSKLIRQTQDGGYIIAGSSRSNDGGITGNHGQLDCLIIKLDAVGNIQWQKSYGGNLSDVANSILQTPDGEYIFAGTTSSTNGDVTGNHGSSDYWVVKLDQSGNIQWQKTYGGSGSDQATSISLTTDGGYIVAGDSSSNNGDVSGNHGNYDFWVVKLNSTGDIQWQKSYGGSNHEYAGTIKQTLDNGYIMTGTTLSNNGDVTQNNGLRDYWVIKIDVSGNLQWQKSYGGSGFDEAFDVIQAQDGNYMVAGHAISSDGQVSDYKGSRDFWILKLDLSGNLLWQKTFGGSSIDGAFSINQTLDGGYIVGGYSQSTDGDVTVNFGNLDYWIVKTDSSGNLQWQKSLGGTLYDQLFSVQQTSDSGYVLVGNIISSDGNISSNNGMYDIWVVKLGSNLGVEDDKNILQPAFYPNPAKDFVHIDNLPKDTNVSIIDISGRKVFSNKYHDEKAVINISSLSDGVYMIIAENKGTPILSEKLVIKNR